MNTATSKQEEESGSKTTEVPNGQEFRIMYNNDSPIPREYWIMNMTVLGSWGIGLFQFDSLGVTSRCFVDPAEEMRDGLKVDPHITVVLGDHRSLLVTHPSWASCTLKKIKV